MFKWQLQADTEKKLFACLLNTAFSLCYAQVTLGLTYAADAADRCSVSVRPIRNDSYLIRNVRNCTYRILSARKIRGQIFITVKNSCADGRSVMVGNGT